MTKIAALVARYQPLADAMAALLYPHVEVVIHDLRSQTVAYIANNVSKRSPGDESSLEDISFDPGESVIGPYEKTNWDGARIRSISVITRDEAGIPEGMLCVNMNLSVFEGVREALSLMLDNALVAPQPERLFRDDWQERINTFLQNWLKMRGQSLGSLSRQQKRDLVDALYAEGAFKGRSAAPYVANVLGLSRATVFNRLKALRDT